MIKKYSIKNEGDKKLSEHFKVKEFACKDGNDEILIDDEVVEALEKIRVTINKPIKIISGYRTASYNIQCGGASDSYHVKGQAVDIQADEPLIKLAILGGMCGFRGAGIYTSQKFVHLDTRETKKVFRTE